MRFRQESFVARVPQTASLVSFVRLNVDVPKGAAAEKIRFTPSADGAEIHLSFSDGGHFTGSSLEYDVGASRTIIVARPVRPGPSKPLTLDDRTYEQARRSVMAYWDGRLSRGATFVVPEPRVLDAERNLLIQNLLMTWRYSLGNAYEAFEFPESLENATVLGEYGFGDVDRAIVEESFKREPHLYPNWQAATRLLAAARYYRLFANRSFVTAATPALQRNAALLEGQLRGGARGLLAGAVHRGPAGPRLRAPDAGRRVAGARSHGARLGGDGPRGSRRREPPRRRQAPHGAPRCGEGVRAEGCPTGRCSSQPGCWPASAPTRRSAARGTGPTGTSSFPTRSPRASSRRTARRRRERSTTCSGTARGSSGSSVATPTRSTTIA